MSSRISVGDGPWYQTMPGAVSDPRTRARTIEIGMSRWMTQKLKRTIIVKADDGDEQLHVTVLGLRH